MKFFHSIFLIGFFALWSWGCTERVIVEEVETDETTVVEVREAEKVKLLFSVQGDYPAGAVKPDSVHIDGTPIGEYSSVTVGSHDFVIEKNGYERIERKGVEVVNSDGDGNFFLLGKLQSKDRVIRFDIMNKETAEPIDPDKVTVASAVDKNSRPKVISDHSYLRPGRKIIVIAKDGFKNHMEEVDLLPDEEPFFIKAELDPEN